MQKKKIKKSVKEENFDDMDVDNPYFCEHRYMIKLEMCADCRRIFRKTEIGMEEVTPKELKREQQVFAKAVTEKNKLERKDPPKKINFF